MDHNIDRLRYAALELLIRLSKRFPRKRASTIFLVNNIHHIVQVGISQPTASQSWHHPFVELHSRALQRDRDLSGLPSTGGACAARSCQSHGAPHQVCSTHGTLLVGNTTITPVWIKDLHGGRQLHGKLVSA